MLMASGKTFWNQCENLGKNMLAVLRMFPYKILNIFFISRINNNFNNILLIIKNKLQMGTVSYVSISDSSVYYFAFANFVTNSTRSNADAWTSETNRVNKPTGLISNIVCFYKLELWENQPFIIAKNVLPCNKGYYKIITSEGALA